MLTTFGSKPFLRPKSDSSTDNLVMELAFFRIPLEGFKSLIRV